MKDDIRFFPFAAGIPWTIKKGKYRGDYIVPKLSLEVWEDAVLDKDIVVLCYGGLIESFFSLSIIKFINKNYPGKNIFWAGYEDFYNMVKSADIKIKEVPDIGEKYPTPLFFDKENNVYINVLNNYLKTTFLNFKKDWKNKDIILKQLFQNALFDWDVKYIPQANTYKADVWLKSQGLNPEDKFVFIVPYKDLIGSIHSVSCLKWDIHNVRELAAILYQKGIKTIIPTQDKYVYEGSKALLAPYDFSVISGLVVRSSIVLSDSIDYLLFALCLKGSKTKIISRQTDGIYDLYKNADYLESSKEIITALEIGTMDVVAITEDL